MVYGKNEKEYQEILHEKFNPDNIFKKKETIVEEKKRTRETFANSRIQRTFV